MSTQYTDLIKTTAQACKSKKTGCVVFISDDESGRIFIKAGKIVGLEYGGETGVDCLSAIAGIPQIDSHEFKEMPVIFGGAGLPETTVLLNALVQRKQVANAPHEVEQNKPVASPPTSPVENPSPVIAKPRGNLSASQKSLIRDKLMALIGPMADFLAEEHVDHADSLEEAMLALRQDIDEDSLAKLRVAVSKAM